MNTSRQKSEPPKKKSPPQKTLFKWHHEQGETLDELAARIVAHHQERMLKGIKPGPFRPPPQNPNESACVPDSSALARAEY